MCIPSSVWMHVHVFVHKFRIQRLMSEAFLSFSLPYWLRWRISLTLELSYSARASECQDVIHRGIESQNVFAKMNVELRRWKNKKGRAEVRSRGLEEPVEHWAHMASEETRRGWQPKPWASSLVKVNTQYDLCRVSAQQRGAQRSSVTMDTNYQTISQF